MNQGNVMQLKAIKRGDTGIELVFSGVEGDIGRFFAAQTDGAELPLEYVEAILRFYLTNRRSGDGLTAEQHGPIRAAW